MKNPILRMVVTALVLSGVVGGGVSGAGWLLGWRGPAQFSNGLFVAGAIALILGFLSVMGGYQMRSDFKILYSQTSGSMDIGERGRRWMADTTQGFGMLILMLLIGFMLIGVAVWVGSAA